MAKEICYGIHTATIGKAYNVAIEEYKKALAELEEKRIFGRHVATYNAKGWAYNRILAFLYRNTNEYDDICTDTKSIRINLRRGCRGTDYENDIRVYVNMGDFGDALQKSLGHIPPSPHNRKRSCQNIANPPCRSCSFIIIDKEPDAEQSDFYLREEFRRALEKHFGGKKKLKKLLSTWRNKYRPKRRVPRRKQETP